MATISMKRGDTFLRTCTYTVGGAAVSITGKTIEAQVRDAAGAVLFALVVTPLAQTGETLGAFTVSAPFATTAAWAPGLYVFDIQITDGLARSSTETVTLRVLEDITHV